MYNKVHCVEGVYWPLGSAGDSCRNYTLARSEVPQLISKYVKNKNVVLHAGGNVGYYASQYANLFNSQYVFEPDFINFYCLNLNVLQNNTFKIQGVLGNEHRLVDLELSADSGGHNLGKTVHNGKYPMFKIDDLNLSKLNLIHLDVEGFEIEALSGGIETIKKYRPIIAAEVSWSNCSGFLQNLGYNKIDEIDGDWVFEYVGK